MTTELEEQFFKVFEIEKIECCKHFKYFDSKCDKLDSTEKCLDCIGTNKVYPKITDRKLLEMICILVKTQTSYPINKSNIKDIKDEVLHRCIILKSYIKHQIQQLFKGEE